MKRRSQRLLAVALVWLPVQVIFAQTTVFSESFDAVTVPDLPVSWDTTGTGWSTSASSSSSGSGLNNLAHTGTSTVGVLTAGLNLTGFASGTLSYLARRTSSYSADSLVVTASIDGGTTFPILVLASGSALPGSSSSWTSISTALPSSLFGESDVRFKFEAHGGTTGGSNIRIDDLLVVAVADSSAPPAPPDSTAGNVFGFQAVSSVALESSQDILLPLDLSLIAPDSLQGLQFSVSWDSSLLVFSGIARGAPVSDSTSWTLSTEPSSGSLSTVLLGQGLNGLPPGAYGGIFSLGFQVLALPDSSADSVHVTIGDVIGSLATPGGTDAGLMISNPTHAITILPRAAYFTPSASVMNLGSIPYDTSITDSLSISNAPATRALTVSSAASSNPAFSVDATGFLLEPDSSRWVSITFSPSSTVFGHQESTISFTHDGTNGPTAAISVSATGSGGRGDLDNDGMVEILDLVKGIDRVLGRILLSARERMAVDVYPFPLGDGLIDVRDLTVLIQGIVRGRWPDGVLLPVEVPAGNMPSVALTGLEPVASKYSAVRLAITLAENARFDLILENDVPLRGAELILSGVMPAPALIGESILQQTGAAPTTHYDADLNQLRLLLIRLDGNVFQPGRTTLASVLATSPESGFQIKYATGIDPGLNRVPVTAVFSPTSVSSASTEIPEDWTLGHPYPNPMLSGLASELSIPIAGLLPAGGLEVELFDILGRRMIESITVTSTGMIRLPDKWTSIAMSPGLYFIRVSGAGRTESRAFSVVY